MVLSLRRWKASGTLDPFAGAPDCLPDARPDSMEPHGAPRFRGARWARAGALGLFAGLLALLAGGYVFDHLESAHFLPGTRIGGVAVGGVDLDSAEALLHRALVAPLHRDVVVKAPGFTERVTPWTLGVRLDENAVAVRVLEQQQRRPFFLRLWHRLFGTDERVGVRPDLNGRDLRAFSEGLAARVSSPPVDASLDVSSGEPRVVGGIPGRAITAADVERALVQGLARGRRTIMLPVRTTPPAITRDAFTTFIVVDTTANTLVLYHDGRAVKRYAVATGTGGYPTPLGTFTVVAKTKYPTWYNPHDPWSVNMPESIPPGPDNPLGTRALYLSADGILIHGTPEDDSIGHNASHGCIRMHMSDVEELYELVPVGTPVVVVS